jgi:hypothetical protein
VQGNPITADPQKLTASVGVQPKEHWSVKDVADTIGHYGSIILTLYGGWSFVQKRLDDFSFLKSALRLNVRNIGIPHRGRYHCTGNSSTDEEVKQLFDANAQGDASRNVPILISGPGAVGKFLIAKSIAAQSDLPLLKIDCAQLANTSAKIPPSLVTLIAWKARLACRSHNTNGVVLVLDGIEKLACAGHDDFIARLKSALPDPTSAFRRGEMRVIGILDTDAKDACSTEQADRLRGLSRAFGKTLAVEPPQTAEERFQLLYSRILSFMRYESPKSPGKATKVTNPVPPDYELPQGDQDFLRALARAMPEIAHDAHVTGLALAISERSVKGGSALTGDDFKSFVLDKALYSIKGAMPKRQKDTALIGRDAHAVISEAFVASALDKTIMALGVQTRSGESYVCRERCDGENSTIGDLLREAIIASSRLLSHSYPKHEHNPFSASIYEVRRLDTAFTEAVTRATQMIAKEMNKTEAPLLDQIKTQVRKIAQAALESLFSETNRDSYEALLSALAPKDPNDPPVELKNGALASLLGQFNFDRARAAAEELLSPQLSFREDVARHSDPR